MRADHLNRKAPLFFLKSILLDRLLMLLIFAHWEGHEIGTGVV